MSSDRRVLVVDDSALLGAVIREVVEGFAGFTVAGVARDGTEALQLVHALDPDIVTLDIEMPGVDGLDVLGYIMSECPRPVVMLSGATRRGAVDLTIRAFELGAVDFVRKPDEASRGDWTSVAPRLQDALRAAAGANTAVPLLVRPRPVAARRARAPQVANAVVAIAASTGGPRALAEIVPALPADFAPAVVIVQHMPAGFTAGLARRLDMLSPLPVREVQSGEPLLAGTVYVAPGGRHVVLEREAEGARLRCVESPPEHGVRPAADPLFRSAAASGLPTLGVVLTGMGRDGSAGLQAIVAAGGLALVQDRGSSAVYGMPAQARGLVPAAQEASLREMAAAIAQACRAWPGRPA